MRINPTVLLFGGVTTVFATVVAALAAAWDYAGWPLITGAFLVQAILFFPAYTVAHDAAHHIASRRRWLNQFILIVCGVLFLFEPYLFRRLHLMHHAHTDEADDDPDLFTAGASWLGRGVRSALLHG